MYNIILNMVDGKIATIAHESDAPKAEITEAVARQIVDGDVIDAGDYCVNMAHVVSFRVY